MTETQRQRVIVYVNEVKDVLTWRMYEDNEECKTVTIPKAAMARLIACLTYSDSLLKA